MSQFSRRARWLNVLFPQSKAPVVTDPFRRSDEVSLVQPYDGGGFGFPNSPAGFFFHATGGTASGTLAMVNTTEEQVFLILAGHIFQTVAPNNPTASLNIRDVTSTPNRAVNIGDQGLIPGLNLGNFTFGLNRAVVMGPEMRLTVDWFGGAAGTLVDTTVYGVLAPLGTVF